MTQSLAETKECIITPLERLESADETESAYAIVQAIFALAEQQRIGNLMEAFSLSRNKGDIDLEISRYVRRELGLILLDTRKIGDKDYYNSNYRTEHTIDSNTYNIWKRHGLDVREVDGMTGQQLRDLAEKTKHEWDDNSDGKPLSHVEKVAKDALDNLNFPPEWIVEVEQ